MSVFKTVHQAELDPHKRVNYVQGLVLGEDEFKQEQLYFLEHDRLHHRALHGYGTVNGLAVSVPHGSPESEPVVVVSPGLALDVQGQTVCVPAAQCGNLNDWLKTQAATGGAATAHGPLYLYLCYRECPTDMEAIPSGPCKTGEENMQPSRIAESFLLKFETQPPDQVEERFATLFGRFLEQIEVTPEAASPTAPFDPEEFFGEEFTLENPPPESPSGSPAGSPADSPAVTPPRIQIHPDHLEATLKAVLRWWITQVRPTLVMDGCVGPPANGCILLARLDFAVTAEDPPRVSGTVTVNEDDRPYLLTTRVLQEWARIGTLAFEADRIRVGDEAGGDLSGTFPDPQVDGIRGRPISESAPEDSQALIWDETEWVPQGVVLDGEEAGSDVTGNYPDKLIVSGILGRSIAGPPPGEMDELDQGSLIVWQSGESPGAGHWTIEPPSVTELPNATGIDVVGALDDLKVIGIRGKGIVENPEPLEGQILQFDGEHWRPTNLPSTAPASPQVVAAGYFRANGNDPIPLGAAFGNLKAFIEGPPQVVRLEFDDYFASGRPDHNTPHLYIVKGHTVDQTTKGPEGYFRICAGEDDGDFGPFRENGILVKLVTIQGEPFIGRFMIEITRINL